MSRRTPINYTRSDHIQQTGQTRLLQETSNLLAKIEKGSDLSANILHNNITLAVHIFGKCVLANVNDTFDVMGSNDNTNYYRITALQPHLESVSGQYHFSHRLRNLTRYVRIQNPNPSRTITGFTLNYNHLVN